MGRQESKSHNQKESQTLHENDEKQERKRYNKIRHCKSETQKLERQAYHHYINTIIEVGDSEDEKPTKQKRFWNYIKSLKKRQHRNFATKR